MKANSLLTLGILFFTLTGCASKRAGVNNGSYSINKLQGHSDDVNPIIYGSVIEYGTKFPVIASRVYVGKDLKSEADSTGHYSFHINPGKYKFGGRGLPYYPTITKRIKVSKGDSVRIDFYLKINDTPLVD